MRRFASARLFGLAVALVLAAAGAAFAQTSSARFFAICHDQDYALCAVAKCFVLDGVSYCKCDLEHGDSISLPFEFGHGQNVCSVDARGAANGYVVSTFSLPQSVVAPDGNKALYDCPASSADGAYAQCDGGVCFIGSEGQSFPGLGPLKNGEIICSCPITVANPPAPVGYQIAGPYPCQSSFFRYCDATAANTNTGSTIYVGAPDGTARFLTRRLYGSVPPLNECRP